MSTGRRIVQSIARADFDRLVAAGVKWPEAMTEEDYFARLFAPAGAFGASDSPDKLNSIPENATKYPASGRYTPE
jgi:hypothetical protein